MEQWTMLLLSIYINAMLIFKGSEAQQPPGYIGCYPKSVANFVYKSFAEYNNWAFCIYFCESSGYRYAATQGKYCKCANEAPLNEYEDDAGCDLSCPVTEHCGGTNRLSVYDTRHLKTMVVTPKPSDPETTSPEGQTNTKASAAKGSLMIAVYISLLVGIIVASSVVLTVYLSLRRQKRRACIKRREVSSCHSKIASEGTMSKDDHYQTTDSEIRNNLENSTQRITTDNNSYAGYLTPEDSNDAANYITPIDSNEIKENYQHYVEIK